MKTTTKRTFFFKFESRLCLLVLDHLEREEQGWGGGAVGEGEAREVVEALTALLNPSRLLKDLRLL